jgi:hypothetical protein
MRRARATAGSLLLAGLLVLTAGGPARASSDGPGAQATAPTADSAEEYCVVAEAVYVGYKRVFGGGRYCVPFPS